MLNLLQVKLMLIKSWKKDKVIELCINKLAFQALDILKDDLERYLALNSYKHESDKKKKLYHIIIYHFINV